MSSVTIHEVLSVPAGTWEDCILPECNAIFYRHDIGHKYYTLGDKLGVCPLCLHLKKMANGTIQKMRNSIVDYHHKNADSKPGSDTL